MARRAGILSRYARHVPVGTVSAEPDYSNGRIVRKGNDISVRAVGNVLGAYVVAGILEQELGDVTVHVDHEPSGMLYRHASRPSTRF